MKSIKDILNVILTFIVLFVATKYFPEYVYVDGTKGLIVTVFLFVLMDIIFGILVFGLLALGVLFPKKLEAYYIFMVIIIIIAGVIWNFVKLYLVSTYYAGFEITGGFMPYLLLGIAFSIFTIKIESNKNK